MPARSATEKSAVVNLAKSELSDRWALVTGGLGGIGAGIACELATGGAATITLLMTNGATAYKVNTVQVNGAAANVVKWSGGTAPTSGNAANVDIYSFTIIKTANSTHSVFASQSQFGG